MEALTIAWMLVEFAAATWAAIAANSLSLLAFGLDSGVELASASVLVWRLRTELTHDCDDAECDRIERVELRASRVSAALLYGPGAYVVVESVAKLIGHGAEAFTPVGLAVTVLAIPIMIGLSAAKLRLSRDLDSASLRADAAQGTACWYLAAAVLIGMALQLGIGAWWADAVASLVIVVFLVREGSEAWSGRHCC